MRKKAKHFISLLIIISIFLLACGKESTIICNSCSSLNPDTSKYCSNCGVAFSIVASNESTIENIKKSDDAIINEYKEDLQGYWVLEYDGSFFVLYFDFEKNEIQEGFYRSEGRTYEVKNIVLNNNTVLAITAHSPEIESEFDSVEPKSGIYTVSFVDGEKSIISVQWNNNEPVSFHYAGKTWDDLWQVCENASDDANTFDPSIPKISASSNILSADFGTLQIRMGYDLSGPADGWRSISESSLYLKNITDVNCYMNISSKNELLGVKNGNIVFYGINGLSNSKTVKDFLPNDALTIAPAVYTIRSDSAAQAGIDAYIWELDNGYMSVAVVPISTNFYDQLVLSVTYVADLSYLSYIGS